MAKMRGSDKRVEIVDRCLQIFGGYGRSAPHFGCAVRMPATCWQRVFPGSAPGCFGPGAAAQTMLGLASIVLILLNDNGTDYRVLVRSSFARYLAEWLTDAAGEFAVAR